MEIEQLKTIFFDSKASPTFSASGNGSTEFLVITEKGFPVAFVVVVLRQARAVMSASSAMLSFCFYIPIPDTICTSDCNAAATARLGN